MLSLHQRRAQRAASPRHRLASVAALVGLFVGAVVTAIPSGAAPPITPTDITVTVSTDTQDVGGADPLVLVEVDNGSATDTTDELIVVLELTPAGATFNQDTSVTLTVGGLGTGKFSPATVTFPRDTTISPPFRVTYDKVESGITMLASAGKGQKAITSSQPSNTFDVGYDVILQDETTTPVTLGSDTCNATSTALCAVVLLPRGVPSRAALATGACTTYYAQCSRTDGRIVSFMADLFSTDPALRYDHDNPVTIVLRCDKTYCRGGGVASYELLARPNWDALTFEPAAACQTKGKVQQGEDYCVDYVQSHRDNAGDLLLYWLVAHDPRGII